MSTDHWTTLGVILGVAVSMLTLWLWLRPGVKRAAAVADAILGEEPVKDRSGREIAPARPGLVSRVGTVEETLTRLVETNDRIDNHELRIKALELGAIERIITKAEAAEMWRAVAEAETVEGVTDD